MNLRLDGTVYLRGRNPHGSIKQLMGAQVGIDFFGDTPLEELNDAEITQLILTKIKIARHALELVLKEPAR